ncbi:ABC transporter ATP-binding protein [Planktotalea sp.]|uniref:ABC transporter ATP-binding protein n=1 Tax=Planktotalea sp. TaxID=2029877 RepID=UPI00329710FA
MYETFRRYLRDFLDYANGQIYRAIGYSFAGALTEGFGLLLLLPILQIVANESEAPFAQWLQSTMVSVGLVSTQSQVIALVLGFVCLIILRNFVAWHRAVLLAQISHGFIDQWRSRVFQALARAQWQTLLTVQQHEGQHAILQDVNRLAGGTQQILQGGVSAALIGVQLVVAFVISPALTSLVLVLLGLAGLILPRLVGRARKFGQRQTLAGRQLQQTLLQFFAGLKLAKVYRSEAAHIERFDQNITTIRQEILRFGMDQATAQAVFQIVSAAMLSAVVVFGLFVLDTTPVTLIAVVVIMTRVSGPVFALFKGVQHIANMLPAYENLIALLARLSEQSEPLAEPQKVAQAGALPVVFRGVSFSYSGSEIEQIADFDADILPGQMLALVGPSGVGKSTILDLMNGLLVPTKGTVEIGELSTAELKNRTPIANSLAYVPQDAALLDIPLRDVLLADTSSVSDNALETALRLTGADQIVERLPDGLNTFVGERGQRLSGGERQRISLSRAILRQPGLLILDEATSALDRGSELRILKALKELSGEMTIVVVTHREVDPAFFDQIISLQPKASR